ncbi:unnamed protein product [Orchesella dallaii]|uniref:Uncharacterized protein n=1 Tax=Orchesella dallaii TaxID=48710 RepID=A0ABP1PV56_9HEXA
MIGGGQGGAEAGGGDTQPNKIAGTEGPVSKESSSAKLSTGFQLTNPGENQKGTDAEPPKGRIRFKWPVPVDVWHSMQRAEKNSIAASRIDSQRLLSHLEKPFGFDSMEDSSSTENVRTFAVQEAASSKTTYPPFTSNGTPRPGIVRRFLLKPMRRMSPSPSPDFPGSSKLLSLLQCMRNGKRSASEECVGSDPTDPSKESRKRKREQGKENEKVAQIEIPKNFKFVDAVKKVKSCPSEAKLQCLLLPPRKKQRVETYKAFHRERESFGEAV